MHKRCRKKHTQQKITLFCRQFCGTAKDSQHGGMKKKDIRNIRSWKFKYSKMLCIIQASQKKTTEILTLMEKN